MVSQRLKLSSPVSVDDSQKASFTPRHKRKSYEVLPQKPPSFTGLVCSRCLRAEESCFLCSHWLKPPLVPARPGYVGRLPVYWLVFCCWRTSTTTQAATPRVWELECGEEHNTVLPPATPGLLSRPYHGPEPELAGKARNQTESNSCLCRRSPSLLHGQVCHRMWVPDSRYKDKTIYDILIYKEVHCVQSIINQ